MANLTPNNRQENWYKGIIDGSTTLTPNNRREYWYQGMIDGSTDLTPNNRREAWYKAIVDSKGGGGGGGGGGDFSTASVTITGDASGNFFSLPNIQFDMAVSFFTVLSNETKTATVILYKNKAYLAGWEEADLSCTGNIEFDSDEGEGWIISGDCTITVL